MKVNDLLGFQRHIFNSHFSLFRPPSVSPPLWQLPPPLPSSSLATVQWEALWEGPVLLEVLDTVQSWEHLVSWEALLATVSLEVLLTLLLLLPLLLPLLLLSLLLSPLARARSPTSLW